jgi:putative ABC transport system ATP-binding protein
VDVPILETIDVVKDYGVSSVVTRALDHVSLAIRSGEFAVVGGPSGCGKTPLLNVLGTLDSPTQGRALVEGQDTARLSEARRSELRLRTIGFIFQAYNLIPVLTATENVEFVLLLQNVSAAERRERARAMLCELGLGDLVDKRPPEMSGGQQQRVAVARAIASGPRIVLADEPTANLDSHTAESLLDLMETMNEGRGVTFLFSTHDAKVMRRARRIIHLVDGRIDKDENRGP